MTLQDHGITPQERPARLTLHLHLNARLDAYLERVRREGGVTSKGAAAASILARVMEDDERMEMMR